MTAKQVCFVVVVAVGGAATAIAQASPALAPVMHVVADLCTPVIGYLGLASPQLLGKKVSP